MCMQVNVHYELAMAGLLLLVFMSYHRQKHLDIYRNKIFYALIMVVVVSAGLNVSAGMVLLSRQPVWLKSLLENLFLIFHQTTFVIYAGYILAWSRHLGLIPRQGVKLFLPYGIGVLLCLINMKLELIFCFGADGMIRWKLGYLVVLLVVCFYLILPVVYVGRHPQGIRRRQVFLIGAFNASIFAAIIVQYLIRGKVLLLYTVIPLVVLLCFLFVQGSDYYMDEVTGFFKMHGFEEVLRERMTYGVESSFLILRIQNYTAMTEMYDDARLTEIQREIAKIINRVSHKFRKKTFYHIAASTFAVILDSPEESRAIYRRLFEELPETWNIQGEEIVHQYSFYVVDTPEDCEDSEQLLQRISYARSDHIGHHRPGELIHLSNKTLAEEQERQKVAQLVEEAILDDSIEIYFQPVYSMEKKRITSLEVLSRLKDKDKNFINPEFFIHVAEENRTIIQLGEQIYRKACIFASQNHIFDMGIENMNINLSPVQCCYEGLADDLVRIAEEYGIPMSRIHLEITESALNDRDEIQHTLERLSEVGAEIALDDFGTGYSSLTSMLLLPIKYVKIDKSLVWSYSEGKNSFLNILIPMIQSEGKMIIAEGIENEEHIEILRRLKGDYLQGYHFSRPLPGPEFLRYLEEAEMAGA